MVIKSTDECSSIKQTSKDPVFVQSSTVLVSDLASSSELDKHSTNNMINISNIETLSEKSRSPSPTPMPKPENVEVDVGEIERQTNNSEKSSSISKNCQTTETEVIETLITKTNDQFELDKTRKNEEPENTETLESYKIKNNETNEKSSFELKQVESHKIELNEEYREVSEKIDLIFIETDNSENHQNISNENFQNLNNLQNHQGMFNPGEIGSLTQKIVTVSPKDLHRQNSSSIYSTQTEDSSDEINKENDADVSYQDDVMRSLSAKHTFSTQSDLPYNDTDEDSLHSNERYIISTKEYISSSETTTSENVYTESIKHTESNKMEVTQNNEISMTSESIENNIIFESETMEKKADHQIKDISFPSPTPMPKPPNGESVKSESITNEITKQNLLLNEENSELTNSIDVDNLKMKGTTINESESLAVENK